MSECNYQKNSWKKYMQHVTPLSDEKIKQLKYCRVSGAWRPLELRWAGLHVLNFITAGHQAANSCLPAAPATLRCSASPPPVLQAEQGRDAHLFLYLIYLSTLELWSPDWRNKQRVEILAAKVLVALMKWKDQYPLSKCPRSSCRITCTCNAYRQWPLEGARHFLLFSFFNTFV